MHYGHLNLLINASKLGSKLIVGVSTDHFNAVKDEFIKEKCKNGVLMYKDMPVKTEMSDHIYSEIKFNGNSKCNPCDRTCDYNIVEAKLKTETALIPKFSKDVKI
jgi:phosphopantetheine adenylyltransferase